MKASCTFVRSRAEARARIQEAMAAAKEGKWSCLLCNVPAAMVGAFLPTPNFDMGDCCAAIYGSCGVCMGPAGHEVGIPPELLRRIEESLRLLSEGEGTEAPVQ